MRSPQRVIAGIAAYLPQINIDTDQIIPKVHLLSGSRSGLGAGLFSEWRYDADGHERPEFILNREPFRRASILVAGSNFGCGSSREHAVWALDGFGIRCVIAPSFASIFHENAMKNGFAAIVADSAAIDHLGRLAEERAGELFEVDLAEAKLRGPDRFEFSFRLDDAVRRALLDGTDEIQLTLSREAEIAAFQKSDRKSRPWVYDVKVASD